MTPPPDPNQTTITGGDWLPGYEITSTLGVGSFGTVVKARQHKLDRVVALKIVQLDGIVNPALVARFKLEAVTLARLHHPNIVQVYDYGFHGGRMFIAMELLEGEDLWQRLRRAGKLDERAAWAVARQTASALAHAAGHGVIHRDIKPSNLFLIPAPPGVGLPAGVPMVKVTDFGLARTSWAADAADGRLTSPGAVLGTPAYMAPEQYRGAADLDHRVDIYALGATVYHALAGRPPFEGATVWDVMAQKLELTPRSWPAVSRESVELIAAMMAPDAAKRIGTYEELLTRIDRLPTARASIPPPARRAPAGTRSRQKRWATVAAAAGLLAVAGVGAHLRLSAARPTATADHAPVAKYVSSGAHEALFDNESIAGWLPPAAGGAWKVEADDEGTVVLTGTGFTRRTFARADDYRVTIGLDVDRAAAAEVHFALPARAPDAARRLVLRVTKAAGAVFGTKDGDRGAFRPLAKPVPFPPAEWFDGRRPYLEVRIERAGGAWAVWFNGTEAGRAADEGVPKAAEIRLHAEGGRARVDSVILAKLALKAP